MNARVYYLYDIRRILLGAQIYLSSKNGAWNLRLDEFNGVEFISKVSFKTILDFDSLQ